MYKLFIKKIVWIIVTFFLVSGLFFFLSTLIPGDRIASVLEYRGISVNSADQEFYRREYTKIEKELGANLPSFYLDIVPSFKKQASENYPNIRIQSWARKMASKKYKFDQVQAVADILSQLNLRQGDYSESTVRSYMSSFYAEEQFSIWYDILEDWSARPLPAEIDMLVQALQTSLVELEQSVVSMYYPVVRWNGAENQYHFWISNILQNRLGTSILDGQNISEKVWNALKWTVLLVFMSIVIALGLSALVSLTMILWRNGWINSLFNFMINAAYAMPIFWLATLLVVFFTTKEYGAWTDLFPGPIPIIGSTENSFLDQVFSKIGYLVLPVVCLVIKIVPSFVRVLYVSLEEQLERPYTQAMRAKGLSNARITVYHLLPNSLIPVITMLSNLLPGALAGSLIIEVIFNVPGMGRLLYSSLFNGEFEVCFAILLIITVVTIFVLALADILYKWVSPQLRTSI